MAMQRAGYLRVSERRFEQDGMGLERHDRCQHSTCIFDQKGYHLQNKKDRYQIYVLLQDCAAICSTTRDPLTTLPISEFQHHVKIVRARDG